jgi:hypothetical protein
VNGPVAIEDLLILGIDPCNFEYTSPEGFFSSGVFDPVTQTYTFQSNDTQTFPPGNYDIIYDANLLGQTAELGFTINALDQCADAVI